MSQAQKRKRRQILYERDNHCHWCGIETKFEPGYENDSATIDHLYSKFNPKRRLPNDQGVERTVLACYYCNSFRSFIECKLYNGTGRRFNEEEVNQVIQATIKKRSREECEYILQRI